MTILVKDDLLCKKAIATAAMNCGKMFGLWREKLMGMRR